jgi:hypothetical protein
VDCQLLFENIAVISMKPASDFESLLVEIKTQNQPWLAKW